MMVGDEHTLQIFFEDELVAQLILVSDEIRWKYEEDWRQRGFAFSPSLPLDKNIPMVNVQRFLRNLLPEGGGLEELLLNLQLSRTNTFGLIHALGNDLPGALKIRGVDQTSKQKNYFREITTEELIQRLDTKEVLGLIIWDQKPRLSIAGVQDKLNVMLNDQFQIGFAEGDLCSTHILKFERKKQSHLVLNEYITMSLAKQCNIDVADVSLMRFGHHRALLVSRFDRKKISDTTVKRRQVIDGCQALNLPPDYKYERNFGSNRDVAHIREGASLPKLFDFASKCSNPALTKLKLLDWVLFNCLTFNSDAHGKNLSFYVDKRGISLAPFYDLVNIAMYPEYEQDMAMSLGDEFNYHCVHAYQLADFAEQCNLSRKLLISRLNQLVNQIYTFELDDNNDLSKSEKHFVELYQTMLHERCELLLSEMKIIQTIVL